MNQEQFAKRHADAVEEFNRHDNSRDGARVGSSLVAALKVLRDSLYVRVHHDVQNILGADSMFIPVSERKTEALTKTEIELYQIAESAAAAAELGYVGADDDWYLQWLTRLRLGKAQVGQQLLDRLAQYSSKTSDQRRLAFTDVLSRVLPESRRAPLVLYRLLPLSVQIATAVAFDDESTASGIRAQQVEHLPAITDCQKCGGQIVQNGEQCPKCGNPLWKFEWLTATD